MQMRCLNAVPLCHAQSVAAGPRQDRGGSSNLVHRGENRGDLGGGRLAGDVDGGAALGRSGGSEEREGGRWRCVSDRSSLDGATPGGCGADTRRSARCRDLAALDSLRATAGERNGGIVGGPESGDVWSRRVRGGRWHVGGNTWDARGATSTRVRRIQIGPIAGGWECAAECRSGCGVRTGVNGVGGRKGGGGGERQWHAHEKGWTPIEKGDEEAEAKSAFDRLIEEGIEPNSGPGTGLHQRGNVRTVDILDRVGCPYSHKSEKIRAVPGGGAGRRAYRCGVCRSKFTQNDPTAADYEYKKRRPERKEGPVKPRKYIHDLSPPDTNAPTTDVRTECAGDVVLRWHNAGGLADVERQRKYLRRLM